MPGPEKYVDGGRFLTPSRITKTRATAKRKTKQISVAAAEARRVDAFMAKQKARLRPPTTKRKPKPKTPQQIRREKAAALRETVEPSAFTRLREALKGKG